MKILITGGSGFVGSQLIPRLERDGHEVRALTRMRTRVNASLPVFEGDAVSGEGLDAALDGVEVAYFLIHSMEASEDGPFADRDRRAAGNFARAAQAAGVARVIYLGGLVPAGAEPSPHLASRLEVERILLEAAPGGVALRASIVIAAGSRSFRFLVRLVERLPVLALPSWRDNRTQPVDGRDVVELLARAAVAPAAAGRSLDAVGPDVLSYGQMISRIRDSMLVGRPSLKLARLGRSHSAGRIAAAIAGEDPELIGPLMAGLAHDLIARNDDLGAAGVLGVRMHSFDSAVERSLRDWERTEPLRAR